MKSRIAMVLVLLTAIAVAVGFSQATKPACPATAQCPQTANCPHQTAAMSSCCAKTAHAQKASLTGAATPASAVQFVAVSDKETKAKDAKESSKKECDMKNCPMKGEKTAMKADGKDCCKDAAKSTKAKAKVKKSSATTGSDSKGTN